MTYKKDCYGAVVDLGAELKYLKNWIEAHPWGDSTTIKIIEHIWSEDIRGVNHYCKNIDECTHYIDKIMFDRSYLETAQDGVTIKVTGLEKIIEDYKYCVMNNILTEYTSMREALKNLFSS